MMFAVKLIYASFKVNKNLIMKSDLVALGYTVPWMVMVLPGLSPPLMADLYGTACTQEIYIISTAKLQL